MENENKLNFNYENKVYLTGRVGAEPRIVTCGQRQFAAFSLCTEERFKDKAGSWVNPVTWHSIIYWGGSHNEDMGLADIHKGAPVAVRGKLRNSKYADRNGDERSVVEILAFSVQPARANESAPAAAPARPAFGYDGAEDLPF